MDGKFQHLYEPEPWDILSRVMYAKALEKARCHETYLQLYIKPKPRWMPDRLFMWLLNRLLFIKEEVNAKWGQE